MHPFNLSKFHFNYKIFSSSKEGAILDVAITSKLTFPSYIIYVKRQHYWVVLDIRQYKLFSSLEFQWKSITVLKYGCFDGGQPKEDLWKTTEVSTERWWCNIFRSLQCYHQNLGTNSDFKRIQSVKTPIKINLYEWHIV